MKQPIGIPYARQQRDPIKHVWFMVCPICGTRIDLVARKDFESFTGQEYRDHFTKDHPTTPSKKNP